MRDSDARHQVCLHLSSFFNIAPHCSREDHVFFCDAEGLIPSDLCPAQQVSSFFCEALLHCDSQGAELLGTALRVCDRTRYFVDREAGGIHGVPGLCIAPGILRTGPHKTMPGGLHILDEDRCQRSTLCCREALSRIGLTSSGIAAGSRLLAAVHLSGCVH